MKTKSMKKVGAWAVVDWTGKIEIFGTTKVSMQGWVARYKLNIPPEASIKYWGRYKVIPVTITYTIPKP